EFRAACGSVGREELGDIVGGAVGGSSVRSGRTGAGRRPPSRGRGKPWRPVWSQQGRTTPASRAGAAGRGGRRGQPPRLPARRRRRNGGGPVPARNTPHPTPPPAPPPPPP